MTGIKRFFYFGCFLFFGMILMGCQNKKQSLNLVDGEKAEKIKEFVGYFIEGPVIGEFGETDYGAIVSFCTNKMIAMDDAAIEYHETPDYYTVSDEALKEYIQRYFDVRGDILSGLPTNQGSSRETIHVNGEVIFYDGFIPKGNISIQKIEENGQEVYVLCSPGNSGVSGAEGYARRPFTIVLTDLQDGTYKISRVFASKEE